MRDTPTSPPYAPTRSASPIALGLIGLALAVGLGLRAVQYFAGASLWFDELAVALNLEERGFAALVATPLDRLQVAPAGFLVGVEAVTRVAGFNELALRAIPFACGLGALFLFWRLTARFARGAGLVYGLVLFAVSPSLVLQSATLKPYSGDVAVTLLLVWLALRHVEQRPSDGRAIAAGVVGSLAILLSNPAVPVAFSIGAVLTAHTVRRKVSVRALAALLVPWAIAAGFAAFAATRALEPTTESFMREFWREGFPPESGGVLPWLGRQLYGAFAYFLIFIVPSGGVLAGIVLLPMALAAVGAVVLVRRHAWRAALVMTPLVAAIGCGALEVLPLRTRVALYACWPILLAACVTVDRVAGAERRVLRVAGAVLAVVSAGIPAAAVLAGSPPPYRAEPMRPVLDELHEHADADDAIYAFHGARHALDFYGPRAGLTRWTDGGEHRDDPRALLRELDALRGEERAWIVYTHAIPRHGEVELMRRYLGTIGVLVHEISDPYGLTGERAAGAWLFDLSDTTLLARTSAASFEVDD